MNKQVGLNGNIICNHNRISSSMEIYSNSDKVKPTISYAMKKDKPILSNIKRKKPEAATVSSLAQIPAKPTTSSVLKPSSASASTSVVALSSESSIPSEECHGSSCNLSSNKHMPEILYESMEQLNDLSDMKLELINCIMCKNYSSAKVICDDLLAKLPKDPMLKQYKLLLSEMVELKDINEEDDEDEEEDTDDDDDDDDDESDETDETGNETDDTVINKDKQKISGKHL